MLTIAASSLLLLLGVVDGVPHGNTKRNESLTLEWAPCDLEFSKNESEVVKAHGRQVDCATLPVPLDYTKDNSDETLDLQLVKISAIKEPVKGSIIFSPGGPGSSGVLEVSQKGPTYQEVFGGHWNVIGFDPRGTGRTMPFICDLSNVTDTAKKERRNWRGNETSLLPQDDMYDYLTSKAWDDSGVFVEACYEQNKEVGHLYSTAFVVRDMVNILDALGEDGKLRFWGRSYATVLGQTFAAMFPDRVDRMFLDSVLGFDDYHSGQWITPTRDTERSLMNFFEECVGAGPEGCPFADMHGPETTAKDLQAELAERMQELIDEPYILPDEYYVPTLPWIRPGGIEIYDQLKYFILSTIYRPEQFAVAYSLIATAFNRDWENALGDSSAGENTTTDPAEVELPWNLGVNAFHGIACGDGLYRASSPEEMYPYVQAQSSQGAFADVFSPQVWVCARWKMDAAERYEGPFTNITTSHPVMFANGLYDPITPLSGALETSANFPGSQLLMHKGHGHGVMSHPSNCTIKAIHDYFNDGTLPEPGTVCEPNRSAFEEFVASLEGQQDGTQDKRMDKASLVREAIEEAKRQPVHRMVDLPGGF